MFPALVSYCYCILGLKLWILCSYLLCFFRVFRCFCIASLKYNRYMMILLMFIDGIAPRRTPNEYVMDSFEASLMNNTKRKEQITLDRERICGRRTKENVDLRQNPRNQRIFQKRRRFDTKHPKTLGWWRKPKMDRLNGSKARLIGEKGSNRYKIGFNRLKLKEMRK